MAIGFCCRSIYEALGVIITRYEATLTCFMPDGLMLRLNAPVPCPEPAVRGLNMALDMQTSVQAIAEERPGLPRIPGIYEYDFIARDGGLMSCGLDLDDSFDRFGALIDRILRGRYLPNCHSKNLPDLALHST
jgi:hypothetical protein